MIKTTKGLLIAAATMAFAAAPLAFSHGHTHGQDKSDREACVTFLQPPVQKGQTLTAAQEEEVRKCIENRRMKDKKPQQGQDMNKPAPSKPDTPPAPAPQPDNSQPKPNSY